MGEVTTTSSTRDLPVPGATMPAAFLAHGTPMNALSQNHYTEAWRAFGQSVPQPRAILMVSAHWYVNVSVVTAMAWPKTIHDFWGFNDELFATQYPAPGDPGLAQQVAEIVKPTWIGQDRDSWGFDHGTWSVLVHAFPEANIPVVQLSINADQPLEYHVDLGAKLAPLREQGVLIIGSGDVAHNLRLADRSQQVRGFDWAERFDDRARELVTSDPDAILRLREHPDFSIAVPTPDHFIPFLYLAGLAQAADQVPEVIVEGYQFASVSMTSYVLGGHVPVSAGAGNEAGAQLPDPAVVPPEDTNL
jgi:4,5-DOPA dioxygenase extradiol